MWTPKRSYPRANSKLKFRRCVGEASRPPSAPTLRSAEIQNLGCCANRLNRRQRKAGIAVAAAQQERCHLSVDAVREIFEANIALARKVGMPTAPAAPRFGNTETS
jgi:hypothetical protein